MPQVTVYIRDEDLEKWKALEKKSEFIHKALEKLGDSEKKELDANGYYVGQKTPHGTVIGKAQ